MRAVSVVVFDDQRMFGSALGSALENANQQVLAVVGSAEDLAAQVGTLRPDVCVLDVVVGGRARIDLVETIRAQNPAVRLLVLTSTTCPELWHAYEAGSTDAVVSKSHGLDTIRTAVGRVAVGERFTVAFAQPPVPLRTTPVTVTDRERDILRLLARGASTHQITESLAISRNTVRTHVQHILDKLHAHTRAQAVQAAMAMHLLLESDLVAS
jgi:DNA-binding NarL/FixJ family response regulator